MIRACVGTGTSCCVTLSAKGVCGLGVSLEACELLGTGECGAVALGDCAHLAHRLMVGARSYSRPDQMPAGRALLAKFGKQTP
jgi:hypothetical protein